MVLDAAGPDLAAALDAGVFMVKPSLGEMRALSGSALTTMAEVEACARQWVARGQAQVVAVSMGERGALMVTALRTDYAPALKVPVVSAVGAGDSFVAGMVYGLWADRDLAQAFVWGVASASAALASSGTGLCALADVQTLVPTVVLMASLPPVPV